MAIEKGQFIEIDYTARTSEDGTVFDTTREDVAEENGLQASPQHDFQPMVVCVGEGHIIKGLDEALVGKEEGSHEIHVEAEHAFGKKDSDKIQLIPAKKFEEQDMEPRPGLEINVDGQYGVIKSVSGGRVTVDFNHPLSGNDIDYEVTINEIVDDKERQAASILDKIQLPYQELEVGDEEATVHVRMELPDHFLNNFEEEFKRLTGLEVTFEVEETEGEHNHEHEH
jgi:FKBP-type peptidyl-prolyl cis-trans isomerase SlyD